MTLKQIAAGVLIAGQLTACGQDETIRGEPYTPPTVSEQEAAVFGAVDVGALPASQRAALVAAHAEAAFALYRAGETDAALQHLGHLDAAEHADLMVGLDTLGYAPDALAAVRSAAESGVSAEEAAASLDAASATLASLRSGAGGDVVETTEFLMKRLAAEFEQGAEAGTITDGEAYQMAYGLAVAARDVAGAADQEVYGDLRRELDFLVLMWPRGGPVSSAVAPPEMQMAEQLARVKLAMAALP